MIDTFNYWGDEGAIRLGDLITLFESLDPDRVIHLSWWMPHSYRGYYRDLGLIITRDNTVRSMLADLKDALGTTYQGWKGGDFTMTENVGVFVVPDEGCTGLPITAALLRIMLEIPGDPWPWGMAQR